MLTVKELRRKLRGLAPETPVLLATDAEGNDFRYLYAVQVGGVTHTGQGRRQHLDFYDDQAEGPDLAPPTAKAAVCLWPED